MSNNYENKLAQPESPKELDGKSGYIAVKNQFCSFPYIGNLFFGDKKDLLIPKSNSELKLLQTYLSTNQNKYKQFIRQKSRFPSFDIYASFQPFNEAFKALYPFVDYIKAHLRPGDQILNLWDRSGWTASMLAGWFPEQHIITVWEGDKDILGYRGFDYWMAPERRTNHTVLFADFFRPFPLENASVAAVIGFDLLHRFNQPELLTEIHRIAKPEAPIIFPHVHLTNSMPEPFFERGCRQLHGTDYQELFDTLAPETQRTGYVLSEPAMFEWNDHTPEPQKPLASEPANPDYNACIAWLPTEAQPPVLKPWRGHEQAGWEQMYLVQNPLLRIDHVTHTIQLLEEGIGYNIPEFLTRHPVYAKRITKSIGRFIEEELEIILYWALQGMNLQQIRTKTGISNAKLQQLLQMAWEADLAQAVPVDEIGFRLQTLLGHQNYLPDGNENNLHAFWKQCVSFYANEPWSKMPDEEALTYAQAEELINFVQKALQSDNIKKGDKILICGELHTEQLLLFWAAVSMGVVIVPIAPNQAPERLKEFTNLIQPALSLVHPSLFDSFQNAGFGRVIMTDQQEDPFFDLANSFEKWLEAGFEQELIPFSEPQPEDEAIILWTTGTTGNSKGITLTQSQLIRSGRIMTETYQWKKTDRYYALGGLDMMSALRHATVSVAEVGACCVIPAKKESIYDHLQTILNEKITILTANPAFFKQLLLSARTENVQLKDYLRLALCTGNQLNKDLRQKWFQQTGIPLYNYFGLTETSGICIAEPLGFEIPENNSIGFPADCLVKVIDETGNAVPVGSPGELCIYGAGIFNGYFRNPEATSKVLNMGWFHTGDTVIQNSGGMLELIGRLSDIIKLPGGSRIELPAIEEIMHDIPNLKDWAVCPVRDFEKEYIAIFLEMENPLIGFEESTVLIKQEITDRIGGFALPALIEQVPFIPRGNHHKVLRKELLTNYFNGIKIS